MTGIREIKGNRLTTDMILIDGFKIERIARDGKRHLILESSMNGIKFERRIDPRETFFVQG